MRGAGRANEVLSVRLLSPVRLLIAVGLLASACLGSLAVGAPAWAKSAWTISTSRNKGSSTNELSGVSCFSSTSCQAVGGYYDTTTGAEATLVESWNGSTWSIPKSPNDGTSYSILYGVSCVSTTWCQAVGDDDVDASQTLIESWNGSKWSMSASPDEGSAAILSGVSCFSSTSCQAVGWYYKTSHLTRTLIESWNGSTWSVAKSADHGSSDNELSWVSCSSSTSCVAVGYYEDGSDVDRTLIESWNGSTWSVSKSTNHGSSDNELSSVSCTSSTSCVAVGNYENASNVYGNLIESWNGSTWSGSTNSKGTGSNFLSGVSCTSSTSCVAVGRYDSTTADADQTLVESWNGSSWTVTSTPDKGTSNNGLTGVACLSSISSTSCQAVGYYTDSDFDWRTLIESY